MGRLENVFWWWLKALSKEGMVGHEHGEQRARGLLGGPATPRSRLGLLPGFGAGVGAWVWGAACVCKLCVVERWPHRWVREES